MSREIRQRRFGSWRLDRFWRRDQSHLRYYLVPRERITPELVGQCQQRRIERVRKLAPSDRVPVWTFGVLKVVSRDAPPAGLDGLHPMDRAGVLAEIDRLGLVDVGLDRSRPPQ